MAGGPKDAGSFKRGETAMNDKQFHEMDEAWMDKMKPLRDKKISEGILKGFSTSVERRILSKEELVPVRKNPIWRAAWVPVFAVLTIASVVILRSPIFPGPSVEYAEVATSSNEEVQDEIEVLKELGVWDEIEDETVIGNEEILDADLELTFSNTSSSGLA